MPMASRGAFLVSQRVLLRKRGFGPRVVFLVQSQKQDRRRQRLPEDWLFSEAFVQGEMNSGQVKCIPQLKYIEILILKQATVQVPPKLTAYIVAKRPLENPSSNRGGAAASWIG